MSVLVALLKEHEELMFTLLQKIEEKRNSIEVRAFEQDLDEIDPDEVIKEMSAMIHALGMKRATPYPLLCSLSLGLQTTDLVQFFQNKINTVKFLILIQEKDSIQEKESKKRGETCQVLRGIHKTDLNLFLDSYTRILQRLEAVQTQIQTIRSNFEALLASQNSETQANLSKDLNWMNRITLAVLPMNVVAGFFGMNLQVPMQGNLPPHVCHSVR